MVSMSPLKSRELNVIVNQPDQSKVMRVDQKKALRKKKSTNFKVYLIITTTQKKNQKRSRFHLFRWDKETGCDLVCRRTPPMETRAADVFNFRPKLRRWKEKKNCYWHEYSWKFCQIFLGIFFLPSVFFFGLKNNEAKSTWQIKEKIFKIKHWLIRD